MISVVIPLYNKEKSIAMTIGSVLNQTFADFELIVVDDGSTDKSAAIVSNISDSRIRLYSKPNGGVSSARNFGAGKACGELVAFLDGDDRWEPTFLETVDRMARKHPGCSMYATDYIRVIADNPEKVILPAKKLFSDTEITVIRHYENYILNNLVSSSAVAVNKQLLERLGGFDTTLTNGEDIDMWFRLGLCAPVCYSSRVETVKYFYSSEYNTFPFPRDYSKYFSYKMATEPQAYLSEKDNRRVREVINTYILYGYVIALRNKNREAASFFRKNIRLQYLSFKSLLKYAYYRLSRP